MTPRSETARRKVLDAAVALLRDAGIPAVTVDAVAKRSGVAKTTIYRHWPSSSRLLMDTIECIIEPFPTPNTGSLRDDLRTLYSMTVPASADEIADKGRLMFGLLHAAADDPDLRSALEGLFRERTGPIRTIVQLAQARGELPDDLDVELAIDMVEGPIIFRYLVRRQPVDQHDFEALLDRIAVGLAQPSLLRSSVPSGA
jgi:AcrR family transcriptional regulator